MQDLIIPITDGPTREYAKNAGLQVGERYEVEDVSMGGSYTSIYLTDIDGVFNSVQFDFEDENGIEVNIYKDPRYNSYIKVKFGYCPICDKIIKIYSNKEMFHCPDCGHHIALHEEE